MCIPLWRACVTYIETRETTIIKTKTTDRRKARRDKTLRKAQKDLDNGCDGMVWHELYRVAEGKKK